MFGVFRVKNHDFTPKNHIFFNFRGGARPSGSAPGYGFLFRSEFFFRTTRELEYLFFLSRKVQIFFSRIQH
jgi:hypothetical protein